MPLAGSRPLDGCPVDRAGLLLAAVPAMEALAEVVEFPLRSARDP
jgi:hypothetical protein